jgi:ribosomal protein L29
MAKEKGTQKKQKVEKKSEKKEKKSDKDFDKMSVSELRVLLQKVHIEVKSGKEKDTSKLKKIKKSIARRLTLKI